LPPDFLEGQLVPGILDFPEILVGQLVPGILGRPGIPEILDHLVDPGILGHPGILDHLVDPGILGHPGILGLPVGLDFPDPLVVLEALDFRLTLMMLFQYLECCHLHHRKLRSYIERFLEIIPALFVVFLEHSV
jgi:hypothetical protein